MHEESTQEYGTLVAKKSERLVTALYLVTDLMAENEPIKHGLRKNAVALLSSMNALAQMDVKDRVIEFKMSLKSVTEIVSLLHVSVTTGIVSDMNGRLLMDGFRSLQSVLEKKQPVFTKEMLNVEGEEFLQKENVFGSAVVSSSYDAITPRSLVRLHENSKELRQSEEILRQSRLLTKLGNKDGNIKRQEEFIAKTSPKREESKSPFSHREETETPYESIMSHKEKTKEEVSSSFQMKKQSRKEEVLSLFVQGVDVSIKDISARIRGCSEKTIQRELNALLEEGSIERIGEKRWSRYILK